MNCKICGRTSSPLFRRKILNKYDVEYFQCSSCGFIQTEEPYWLEEAYRQSMTDEDTGIVKRNILLAKRTSTILYFWFNRSGKFLDYGGGYGLLVRLMRDTGFNFFWNDPFTENLFARGFEYHPAQQNDIELITSFESFEHFADPMHEIETMFSISGSILFSTETFSSGTPDPDRWRYYYFSHGQHISLYSDLTLRTIAGKFHKQLYTNGKSFHLLTDRSLPQVLFSPALKLSLLGLHPYIAWRMESKTINDSAMMAESRLMKNGHTR